MQPVSACRSASSYKISLKSDNRLMSNGQKSDFKMAAATILNYKNFNFSSRDCHQVQYLMQYTKFQQIGQFFTEIRRFNDFQNGGRPPSWILKICIFCPVALGIRWYPWYQMV